MSALSSDPSRRFWLVTGILVFLVALGALAVAESRSAPEGRLSERQALRAALGDADVRTYLARFGYTRSEATMLDDRLMRATFFDGRRVVLDAAVDPDGRVLNTIEYTPRYVRAGSEVAQRPWVLALLAAAFALFTVHLPLLSVRNLDVAALLAFLVPIVLLNDRLFELSVYASVPPLAYLGARCLWVALVREASPPESVVLYERLGASLAARERGRLLAMAAAAAVAALVLLSVPGGLVGDVGFASMAGATDLLEGALPYGQLPPELVHGDTYPLLAYALYIPVALFMPVQDAFSNLDGALIVATAAALAGAAGVYVAAGRLAGGGSRPAGLRHAIAWLVFPPVLITASSGSNDLAAAAFVAWALALVAHAGRSTVVLTVAAWVKLAPFFVLPLWVLRLRSAGAVRAIAGSIAVTGLVAVWILALGGVGGIADMVRAVSFQAERGSILSLWAQLDVRPLQLVFQAAVVSLIALTAVWVWRDRTLAGDVRRIGGLAGAILIGVQLGASYWTYAYLPWVFPFLAAALLWERSRGRAAFDEGAETSGSRPGRA